MPVEARHIDPSSAPNHVLAVHRRLPRRSRNNEEENEEEEGDGEG